MRHKIKIDQRQARAAVAGACLIVAAACSGSDASKVGANTSVSDEADTQAVDTEIVTKIEEPADAETLTSKSQTESPEPKYETAGSQALFDQSVVRTFEINLPAESLAKLDADPAAEEYVEGSLTLDGETIERIGVRYKGSIGAFLGCTEGPNPFEPSGAKTCPKLSIKLKINWDGADTEFYGQRKVQLHSMNNDPTLMRERLGYLMFAEAGVPSPRATHARVVINDEFVGLFALIEQIDGQFARDRFSDGNGNLYKEVWPFDADGEVQSAEVLINGLKTNEKDDPSTDLTRSLANEILDSGATTDAAAARRVLGKRTEVDSFVAYAVVDRAINHDDGPFHWYCSSTCEAHNYYLYEEPAADVLHIIPWDLDNAMQNWTPDDANPIAQFTKIADEFGEISNDCQPFQIGGLAPPQRSAACDPLTAAWSLLDEEFDRINAEFRSGPFAIENVSELLESWRTQIAPHVAEAADADPQALTVDVWNASLDQLLADIAAEPSRQES